MDTTDPWYKSAYSKEDHEFLEGVFGELQQRGLRWSNEKGADGKYIIHLRGIKTWLSGKAAQTEKFVLACWRLKRAHRDLLTEKVKLVRKLEAVAGTSEIVDLEKVSGLHIWIRDEFRGVMVPKEHAERLAEAINKVAHEMRQHGFEEGSNILHRLGTGDISVLDFEKEKAKMQDT